MKWPRARIFRILYRTADGKLIKAFTKIQYSGLYPLAETLSRALATGEIAMFSLAPAKATEITPGIRSRLQRWPEALRSTSERSGVSWTA